MSAFKRSKKEDPYSVPAEAPKWAKRTQENVGGTWATYDSESASFQMDNNYEKGNTGGKIFEDADWIGGELEEGEDDVERFKMKFVDERDIMYDNQPRSSFDVRNSRLRGFGGGIRPNKTGYREINVQIGEQSFKSRHRASNKDFLDSKPHNMLTKGQKEERKIRTDEREEELVEHDKWRKLWDGLTEEQKQEQRDEKTENDRKMMESFRFQVVNAMPDEVMGMGMALQHLDIDEAASSNSTDFDYSGDDRGDGRSSRQSGDTPRRRDDRSRSPYNTFGSASDLVSLAPESRRSSIRSNDSYRMMRPPPLPPQPRQYDLPQRARTSSAGFRPVEQPFRVGHHPLILPPPDDVESYMIPPTNDAQERGLMKVFEKNSRMGRVLTIRLDPKVTTPFPEAITDRMWGGMLQQLIFDPDSRHAVAIFVTSTGCAAFLTHWRSIEKHGGAAELRRLQIAVDWHEGSEATAIMASQRNVIRAVSYLGASRVLVIYGLDKHIKKQDAEAGFRANVGLDRVICKGRLVVPAKLYQKKDDKSNKLVVEFASIRDAVDVRTELNQGSLGADFAGCTAEFARDSVDKPPVVRDYCSCWWCVKARAGELKSVPGISLSGTATASVRI